MGKIQVTFNPDGRLFFAQRHFNLKVTQIFWYKKAVMEYHAVLRELRYKDEALLIWLN